jgi:hypothetical protein
MTVYKISKQNVFIQDDCRYDVSRWNAFRQTGTLPSQRTAIVQCSHFAFECVSKEFVSGSFPELGHKLFFIKKGERENLDRSSVIKDKNHILKIEM